MVRLFDLILSALGVLFLLPVFLVIAIIIKWTSPGPVFYKQTRVGKDGVDFLLFKFRSMHVNADRQGLLTIGGRDPRVSRIGYYLRKYKLDELPQLINVLFGDMSLVGPRPEVRKYVLVYTAEQAKVLSVRPGITDWASIKYRDENQILAHSADPEKTYIEEILPAKIKYNMIFIERYSISEYLKIIFNTILHVFTPFKSGRIQ